MGKKLVKIAYVTKILHQLIYGGQMVKFLRASTIFRTAHGKNRQGLKNSALVMP
jgi:hypothetical protein